MADRIIKSDSGNDVVIQNDDASAKIEINDGGTIVHTGTSSIDVSGGTFTTSSAQKQAIISGGGSSEAKGLVPVGAIFSMAFTPGSTWLSTNKFLICDGSSLNSSTDTQYADLYSAIGTTWGGSSASAFNIPDLRGAFLRGTGSNGTHNMADGNDFAGPSVGSFENDQIQKFKRKVTDHNGNQMGRAAAGTSTTNAYSTSGSGSASLIEARDYDADGEGTPRVGDETRPFNAGVQFIIKF